MKRQKVTRVRTGTDGEVILTTYLRRVRKPTIEQFAVRERIKQLSKENRGTKGTSIYKDKLVPSSAKNIGKSFGSMDKIITDELREKYNKKFKIAVRKRHLFR